MQCIRRKKTKQSKYDQTADCQLGFKTFTKIWHLPFENYSHCMQRTSILPSWGQMYLYNWLTAVTPPCPPPKNKKCMYLKKKIYQTVNKTFRSGFSSPFWYKIQAIKTTGVFTIMLVSPNPFFCSFFFFKERPTCTCFPCIVYQFYSSFEKKTTKKTKIFSFKLSRFVLFKVNWNYCLIVICLEDWGHQLSCIHAVIQSSHRLHYVCRNRKYKYINTYSIHPDL